MKIPNPEFPVFVQRNNGKRDPNSNIASSWNCDFSRYPGKVVPSPRLIQGTNTTDEAALEQAMAFVAWDDVYWSISETYAYIGDAAGDFNQDGDINAPGGGGNQAADSNNSDIVVFDGAVVASLTTQIYRRDATTSNWTKDWFSGLSGGSTLNSAYPHPMESLKFTSVLAIGDQNAVHTAQGTGGTYTATSDKLTLDASQYVKWIRSGSSKAYIGTTYNGGGDGEGLIYEWDGGDTVPTRIYSMNAHGALAAVVAGDILYVLTSNMELQRLDAGGLVTVAKFPIANTYQKVRQWNSDFNPCSVHHRGMAVKNGKILINISSRIDTGSTVGNSYLEAFPSGVWEYDPLTGRLSHKYSTTVDKTGAKDMGQWSVPDVADSCPGAIVSTSDSRSYSLLVGSGYYSDNATTDAAAIYVDDHTGTTKRRARLSTVELFTQNDSTYFNKIALKYAKMKNANDKILVKYRTKQDATYPIKASVTWSSTTQFTTTDASFANVQVGDEVFVLTGNGGGSSAHVTVNSESGGTYTVTLDEAVYGVTATNTSIVVVDNWKKLASFTDQVNTHKEIGIPAKAATSIEVLIELRSDGGDSPILHEIDIIEDKNT